MHSNNALTNSILSVNVPQNKLFTLQWISHIMLVLIAGLTITLKHAGIGDADGQDPLYGYEILSLVSACVAWPLCLAVLYVIYTYMTLLCKKFKCSSFFNC